VFESFHIGVFLQEVASVSRISRFALLVILFPLFVLSALGQFAQRGVVQGMVTDSTGAAIPGAEISLVQNGQSHPVRVHADSKGHYEFDNLVAGQYNLTATAQGFRTAKADAVAVNIGANTTFNLKLEIGSVNDTVTVSAEGGGIQTEQTSVSTNFSARQIENLPLNGLNFTSLQALVPGISTYPQSNINVGGTFAVGAQFAFGGIEATAGGAYEGSRDTGYYINGVNVNDNYESSLSSEPAQEALGTGTSSVTDFSAAVGRDFSTLGMQTKGGSNKFHGEAYDFLQNTDLDATNPYNKLVQSITGTPAERQVLIRNQFGGNISGPVYIPKLLPHSFREKFFFFVNYQKLLEHDGNTLFSASVPSAAERTGDYSELLVNNPAPQQLYNPYYTTYDESGNSTRPAIPNNRLDLATKPDGTPLIDQNAVALINAAIPLPNVDVPSNETNYVGYQAESISDYHIDTRFDARITPNDSAFVTWSTSKGANSFSGGPQPYQFYTYPTQNNSYLVTVNYAHIFTPRLTNEFIFGIGNSALVFSTSSYLSYFNSSENPFNQYLQNTGEDQERGAVQFNINGYASPGNGYVSRWENDSLQFSDNVNWVHGPHKITAGFNYFKKSEYDWYFIQAVNFTGEFSTSGSSQGYIGGDASADTLMGLPDSINLEIQAPNEPPNVPGTALAWAYYGMYVNDMIRLNPKLTLSLGLRYDLVIPPYNPEVSKNLCCSVYLPDASGGTEAFPGIAPSIPIHYVPTSKTDVAPRVSIIFSARPTTVVRAAYGMFYVAGASQISNYLNFAQLGVNGYTIDNATLDAPPDTPVMNFESLLPQPITAPIGSFPVSTGVGQGYVGESALTPITYLDQKSTTVPYYQRMMLDVQQALGAYDTLTIGYAGVQGRRGLNQTAQNLPPYQTGWTYGGGESDPAFNAARPNNVGRFSDINVYRNNINSHYNALIVQYEHRFHWGFQITSNYTWSKNISNYPIVNTLTANGTPGGGVYGFVYPNLRSEGESTQSHPHRFVFGSIWEPKYGSRWPEWAKLILTGWRVSGITTLESGDSLTVTNGGPGTPCPTTDAGTAICPTGYGSSAQDGAGFDELNVNGNPNIGHFQKTALRQFNASAFSVPAMDVRGNSGFGTVRGPGQNNVDLSLAKTFPIKGSLHIEFRADAFNAFNHTQWTSLNTTYPNGNPQFPFGSVSSAREARIGQIAAKLVF
jgi:hypothetical protein